MSVALSSIGAAPLTTHSLVVWIEELLVFAACLAQSLQVGQILGAACLLLERYEILVADNAHRQFTDLR